MENQLNNNSSAIEEYFSNVTGSSEVPTAQVTEVSNSHFVTRRWISQAFLAFAAVKGLEGKTDPCPSPPCEYKMGD